MGYFSELDYLQKNNEDIDAPDRLLWRYEDLKAQYWNLWDGGAPSCGDDCFTADDYRYASPSCFTTLADVYRAMELAKEDLKVKYGITVEEDEPTQNEEETCPNQLSLFEFILLPPLWQAVTAA